MSIEIGQTWTDEGLTYEIVTVGEGGKRSIAKITDATDPDWIAYQVLSANRAELSPKLSLEKAERRLAEDEAADKRVAARLASRAPTAKERNAAAYFSGDESVNGSGPDES